MKKLRQLLKIIAIMLLMLASGCMSNDIVVDPVQPWEGHYMTVEEFKEKTADI